MLITPRIVHYSSQKLLIWYWNRTLCIVFKRNSTICTKESGLGTEMSAHLIHVVVLTLFGCVHRDPEKERETPGYCSRACISGCKWPFQSSKPHSAVGSQWLRGDVVHHRTGQLAAPCLFFPWLKTVRAFLFTRLGLWITLQLAVTLVNSHNLFFDQNNPTNPQHPFVLMVGVV